MAKLVRAALLGTATALAMGCSLLVDVSGLTGDDGAASARPEAGAAQADADADADGVDAPLPGDARPYAVDTADGDAASPTGRVWRRLTAPGPQAIHSARMAFDVARGKAVLVGGVNINRTPSAETWEWNGTAWSQPMPTVKPSARRAPGLAYDSVSARTRLVAGSGSTPEPWEWDGSIWKASGMSSPAPASLVQSAGLAYDSARNVLVEFGGHNGTAAQGDTWEWSAAGGYVKRAPVASPSARRAHVFVYDAARARTLLFGGFDGALRNDLWEWDGTTWTKRQPALSPAPRKGACAAYDSARKVTVVFGGRGGNDSSALGDTWEWDGAAWRQGPTGPSARSSCAMTFDSVRKKMIMFGGSSGRINPDPPAASDETWVYE